MNAVVACAAAFLFHLFFEVVNPFQLLFVFLHLFFRQSGACGR